MEINLHFETKSSMPTSQYFVDVFGMEPDIGESSFSFHDLKISLFEKKRNGKQKISLNIAEPIEEIIKRVEFFNYRHKEKFKIIKQEDNLLEIKSFDGHTWTIRH